jgi:hypothetical protein
MSPPGPGSEVGKGDEACHSRKITRRARPPDEQFDAFRELPPEAFDGPSGRGPRRRGERKTEGDRTHVARETREFFHRHLRAEREDAQTGGRQHQSRHLQAQTVGFAGEGRENYEGAGSPFFESEAPHPQDVGNPFRREVFVPHLNLTATPSIADQPNERRHSRLEIGERIEPECFGLKRAHQPIAVEPLDELEERDRVHSSRRRVISRFRELSVSLGCRRRPGGLRLRRRYGRE